MDSIFKHVINKVWVWFDKVIKCRKNLQIFSFLLMKKVEPYFILIKFHLVDSLSKLTSLVLNHLFSFLDFLFLLLELFDLFVDLFLHHLEEILVLDFKLVHDSSETFFKLINFFIKLLSDFHFKFIVEFLINCQ